MPLHTSVSDHVVTITIDRPARRNSLDLEHFDALADAWKRFRDDPDAWVAIVTGVDDAFCAGGALRDSLPLLSEALASGRAKTAPASAPGPRRCCATSRSTSRSSPRSTD